MIVSTSLVFRKMLYYLLIGLAILLLLILFLYYCFRTQQNGILEGLVTEDIKTLSNAPQGTNHKRLNEKEKKILQNGYPVWKKNRLYYSSTVTYRHIVPHYPAKIEEIRRHKVPANIFQCFNHRVLQDDYYRSISSTIRLNPTYEYYFYDTYECRRLIARELNIHGINNFASTDEKNRSEKFDAESSISEVSVHNDNREISDFGTRVLNAYDKLIPGAYRSDLWRLCVLYVYGGVYLDLKLHPTHGFNDIIDEEASFVMAVEEPQSTNFRPSMLTSFIASVPRHPFLLACIEAIVDRVEKNEMGINEWDVTGPLLYASVMTKLYGQWPPREDDIQVGRAQWYPDLLIYYDNKAKIKLRIPETSNEDRFSTMTPEPYYRTLWKEKAIYHK